MDYEIILKNFEVLLSSPKSMQKMRTLIRDMAVKGLILNNSMEKIHNELPPYWSRVSLEEIGAKKKYPIGDGDHGNIKPSSYTNSGVPYIRVKDIGWGTFEPNGMVYIPNLVHQENLKSELVPGDILIAKTGATIGKCCIIPENIKCANTTSSVGKVSVDEKRVLPEWVLISILTTDFYKQIWAVSKKTAQPGFNIKDLKKFKINLPPIDIQREIISKIDELMEQCNRLEDKQNKVKDHRLKINKASLNSLLNAKDSLEFSKNWKLISDNFQLLYNNLENVKELRQAILQLAVMGKLVEQDSDDEPASVLLENIRGEKEQLVNEGKIRKQKMLSPIEADEVLFEVPEGWEWCRLLDITADITSGSRGWNKYYAESGATFIRSQDIKYDRLEYDKRAYVALPSKTEGTRTRVRRGDWALTITGANVGKCAHLVDPPFEGYVSQHVALIRPVDTSLGRYGHLWLIGEHGGRGVLLDDSYGAKPGLNLNQLRELPVPIPPLAEQHRIVAKVEKLMSICDLLEAKIEQSQNHSEKLLNAVIHEVLAG